MKAIIALALLLLLPFRAFAFCGDWSTSDTVLAVSYSALLYVDWRQTKEFLAEAGVPETNPLVGRHPSGTAIDQYTLGSLLGGLAIACFLSNENRPLWLTVLTGIELYSVGSNHQHGYTGGISLRF